MQNWIWDKSWSVQTTITDCDGVLLERITPSKRSFAERFRVIDPFHAFSYAPLNQVSQAIKWWFEQDWETRECW